MGSESKKTASRLTAHHGDGNGHARVPDCRLHAQERHWRQQVHSIRYLQRRGLRLVHPLRPRWAHRGKQRVRHRRPRAHEQERHGEGVLPPELAGMTTDLRMCLRSETTARVFRSSDPFTLTLIERSKLESKSAGYVVDNVLTIECRVTVVKQSQVSDITRDLEIEVPPSDLSEHFGKLLLEEERADITFIVGGEKFPAHKIVLATWSPVFKAELYGQMKERRARHLTVEDMQPEVFKALLQFIYTDSLPDWDELDADENCEVVRHLLVAADRYAMDRLKLLCASLLVEYLDVETAATTLALADQHNCDRLKDVCIEFMASSGEMEAVVATQGYANLKRTCPSILVDLLEKTSRYRKT